MMPYCLGLGLAMGFGHEKHKWRKKKKRSSDWYDSFFFSSFFFFFFFDSVLRPFQAFSLISRRINR